MIVIKMFVKIPLLEKSSFTDYRPFSETLFWIQMDPSSCQVRALTEAIARTTGFPGLEIPRAQPPLSTRFSDNIHPRNFGNIR